MTNLAPLTAIDIGINLWWRTIGKLRGFSYHTGDIEWVSSESRTGPERIFNVRLSDENAADRIVEIAAAIRAGALPSGILLTPLSTPENIVAMLIDRGFTIEDSCPCMALCLDGFIPTPVDEHIKVVPVEDGETLGIWAGIVNRGLFGCELFSMGQYADMFHMENTNHYVACLNGEPAAACMTIYENRVATLECVATLPEYRRMGLGRAVVSHALEALKRYGGGIVTLRSEPDGVNLYRRLGFREYCKRVVASL